MNKKVNGFYFYDSPRAISRIENIHLIDVICSCKLIYNLILLRYKVEECIQ